MTSQQIALDGVTFEKPVTQARITPKGLAKLAVVFGEVAA